MQMHAALIFPKPFIKITKMRYTLMLSDVVSKIFQILYEEKVHGHSPVMKEECINHVSKRPGA